jgi:hypothetical protein
MSVSKLPSPATRLSASEVNATRRPSALIEADDDRSVVAGMVTSWRMEVAAQTGAEPTTHFRQSTSRPAARFPARHARGCPASKVPGTRAPELRLQLHSLFLRRGAWRRYVRTPPALNLPDRWPRRPSTHRDSWPSRTEEHGELACVDGGTATVHAAWTGTGELVRGERDLPGHLQDRHPGLPLPGPSGTPPRPAG